MGKNLKGKELGPGLRQEKNGTYSARYRDAEGVRRHRRFKELNEARVWLVECECLGKHKSNTYGNITVNEWFKIFANQRKNIVRPGTMRSYEFIYRRYIFPYIGLMKMQDVRPMNCQSIFNVMAELGKSTETMRLARALMSCFFNSAVDNEVIDKSPLKRSVKATNGKPKRERNALTLDEQKRLLQAIEGEKYELVYRFVLQSGLRSGELLALTWDDIDFDRREIHIRKTLEYKSTSEHVLGPPKSKAGIRTIPLTDEAIAILKLQAEANRNLSIKPKKIWKNQVFIGKKGVPVSTSTYSNRLRTICKRNGLRPVSMHILRHTFATRCIEAGMKPKTLQTILGHENISMTMNMYVHITDEEKSREINGIQEHLLLI